MAAISFYSDVLQAHGEYSVCCCDVLQVKAVATPAYEDPFSSFCLFFV
jgi:hypothetical protein